MKKLVTVLLVVAMVLSLASVAFAAGYSDVADLSQGEKASIAKLNALNIINGYPDGTYKPANNITRAEFAKIACIAGGMGSSAAMLQGTPSQYSDVAAAQWYTGYINLASSQGWVKGFPDGTFRPNSQITYAQVITVLVRLLGYNDNLPGPWPVDYIAKAGQIDITKDVSFNANAPATRVDVAVMADATLDATVVKWDNDTEDFEEKTDKNDKEVSLLADKFDTAVNEDYLVTDAKHDDGVWSIRVERTDNEEDMKTGWYDLAKDCVISDGSLPTGIGSAMVDLLYNDDDEEIIFVDVTSTKVTVDGEDWEVNKTDSKGNPTQYKIDGTKYDVVKYKDIDLALLDNFSKDKYYRAYINEDKEVYLVKVRPTETPAIVDAFEDGELALKYDGDYGVFDEIEDIDFEDDDVLIEKDGKFVDAKELKENDAIYVDEDSYGYDYYIEVAGNINKTGTLQAVKDSSVKIDGTWYDVAAENALSDDDGEEFNEVINSTNLEDSDDEVITYFLNKSNQVCFVITSEVGGESSKTYGVITDLGYKITRDGNMVNEIKVLKADGKEVTYKVDTDDVEYYRDANDGDVLDLNEFIKFGVNKANEIDSLTILEPVSTVQDGNDDTNKIKVSGSWYTLTDKTVVFNGALDPDDAEVISNDDLIDWAETKPAENNKVYIKSSGAKLEYVFVNADIDSASSVDYALVLDNYTKAGNDWVEIDVKGTSEYYEVKKDVPNEYCIYDYSISGSKFSVDKDADVKFNPSVVSDAYYEVVDVDRSGNAVKVAGIGWLYADEDTVIYDYTDYYADGDDPEYASSLRAISKGDYIVYVGDEDEVDLFVIVTNIPASSIAK